MSVAQLILSECEIKPERCFVSIYRTERCYGGPEEGGWWYDWWTLEGSKEFLTREQAEEYLEQAKRRVSQINDDQRPQRYRNMAALPDEESPYADCTEGYIPSHWSDGGEFKVVIEDVIGESESRERPHYE